MGHLFTRHRHAAQVEKERESISAEATLCKQQLAEAEAALATHKAETKRLGELLHGADQVGCGSCGPARSLAFVGGGWWRQHAQALQLPPHTWPAGHGSQQQ